MNVIVFGKEGQLARHLAEVLPSASFLGRAELDLLQSGDLLEIVASLRPSALVNAAAYTWVDKAETDEESAWRLNAQAPALMASAAARFGIPFVHVSTDYVFDGKNSGARLVTDPCAPINAYGRTKLAGEIAVRSMVSHHWILRTSWVFSEHGSNFVKTILRLAPERPELRVVDDQFGVPTYARDLARVVAGICSQSTRTPLVVPGTYHAVGGPPANWCEFAQLIVGRAVALGVLAKPVPVRAISTNEFPTAAARPANSVLCRSPELDQLPDGPFDWRQGLDHALLQLSTQSRR